MTIRVRVFTAFLLCALGLGVVLGAQTNVLNPASDLSGKTLVTAEGNRTITGTWSFSVPLRANPGISSAPGLVSTSDQTTGWQLGVASLGGSISGTQRFLLNGSGLTVYGNTVVNTSGIVPFTAGGTGIASATSGGMPYFNTAASIASSALLTANGVLIGGGVGVTPATIAVGTTNQVLQGNTGVAPSFAALASTQLSDLTAWTSWTPTDQSGASLTFTNTFSRYYQLGKLVTASLNITFPVTGSGANVSISLPVTPITSSTWGCAIGFNQNTQVLEAQISGGTLILWDNSGARRTNTQLSNDALTVTCTYGAN